MTQPLSKIASHPQSTRAYERARAVMPGGNTRSTAYESPHPVYLAAGSGPFVRDLDGRRYLDLQNNFTTLIHGHCHPATVAALQRQLAFGTCFSNPTLAEIELAEVICARVPHFEHLRFANTGTEAVMLAVKAARAVTGRSKIAKCEGAYHGGYDLVEVSLDPTPETWGEPLPRPVALNGGTPPSVLKEAVVLPFNDVAASEALLSRALPDLAAVLIDPMPSRMGLIPATAAYLEFLRAFRCRRDAFPAGSGSGRGRCPAGRGRWRGGRRLQAPGPTGPSSRAAMAAAACRPRPSAARARRRHHGRRRDAAPGASSATRAAAEGESRRNSSRVVS
jgi:glutamate-1-semialdehyde aminotransferase